jgi:hypothetical protein
MMPGAFKTMFVSPLPAYIRRTPACLRAPNAA